MSGEARKRKPVASNEPIRVIKLASPLRWTPFVANNDSPEEIQSLGDIQRIQVTMMQAWMMNEERRFMWHDSRRRWSNWPSSLVYPIERDETKCRYECRCYLEKHEEEPCQRTSISVSMVTRLRKSSRSIRTMILYRARNAMSQWLMSFAGKMSVS